MHDCNLVKALVVQVKFSMLLQVNMSRITTFFNFSLSFMFMESIYLSLLFMP